MVGSWSNNYNSWKNNNSIKNIIIKYEDMINNPEDTFEKITIFLNKNAKIKYDKKKNYKCNNRN